MSKVRSSTRETPLNNLNSISSLSSSKNRAVPNPSWLAVTGAPPKQKPFQMRSWSKRESMPNFSRAWWTNTVCNWLNGRSLHFSRSSTHHIRTYTMSLRDIIRLLSLPSISSSKEKTSLQRWDKTLWWENKRRSCKRCQTTLSKWRGKLRKRGTNSWRKQRSKRTLLITL